jgi:hypothetical protein
MATTETWYEASMKIAHFVPIGRRFKKIGQSETRINGLGQNVQSLEDLLRCFLPSFSSFGSGVSEEKIKM